MPIIRIPFYSPDSRGNRLEQYEVTNATGSNMHTLYLCGPERVAQQVRAALTPAGVRDLPLRTEDEDHWTHRMETPRKPEASVDELLKLLQEMVTVECRQPPEFALALDFYKDPESHTDSRQWKNTSAGGLVHTGKYEWWKPIAQRRAGTALADLMAETIKRHPLLGGCPIVSIPGSDSTKRSFGDKVAEGVARRLDVPFYPTQARTPVRPSAKNRDAVDFDLEGEFTVTEEVAFQRVLIVDDVYRTGGTMRAVAEAAAAAGAAAAYGLVGARTMRN